MDHYFIQINIMQIFIIYRDRQAVMIPEQIRDLYENIFSSMTTGNSLIFGIMENYIMQIKKHLSLLVRLSLILCWY